MSYIVPRDIPKTCGECPFSHYSETYNSLMCALEVINLCVEREERYAFCKLVEAKGTLFNAENAKRYLGQSSPTSSETAKEVTE